MLSNTRRACRPACVDAPPDRTAGIRARDLRHAASSTRRARSRSTAISVSSCWGFWRQTRAARRSTCSSRRSIADVTGADVLMFTPPPAMRRTLAPTTPLAEDLRRGDDADAASCTTTTPRRSAASRDMRGLFGPASAVGAFARVVLRAARGDEHVPQPFTPELVAAIHHEEPRARKLARARVGHDAADLIVRHADVAVRVRPRRLHGHVVVDRSGARSLLRAADEPRARNGDRSKRCATSAARFTTRWQICKSAITQSLGTKSPSAIAKLPGQRPIAVVLNSVPRPSTRCRAAERIR